MAITKKKMAEASAAVASAMPEALKIDRDAPEEILSRWWTSDIGSWGTALEALAPTMSQKQLDSALRSIGSNAQGRYGDARASFMMAEALLERGADPFAKNKPEDPGSTDHRRSFFGWLIKGGYWAYAAKIASAPENRKKCFAETVAESPKKWASLGMGPGDAGELLALGGAHGFKLGFIMGMSPNDLVAGQPWFFLCATREELAACIEAGADLSLKGEGQRPRHHTFEESLCLGMERGASSDRAANNAERSAMISLIRAQGATLDKDAGRRALEGMAKSHSTWAEVKKIQKTYGIDAAKTESLDGASMLELSLSAGNWMLASNLIAAGADPHALSKRTKLPAIAAALWSEPAKAHEHSRKAEGPAAQRKRAECEAAVLAALDVDWRSEDGEPLLLAAKNFASRNKPAGRGDLMSTTGLSAMIDRCKIDAKEPLWRRLVEVDAPIASIKSAALSRAEPWMCGDGVGLLSTLLKARASEKSKRGRYEFGYDHMKLFAESLLRWEDKDAAWNRAGELFSAEQWRSAWPAWAADYSRGRDENDALTESMIFAVKGWIGFAKTANIGAKEMFDYPLMGELVKFACMEYSATADLRDAALSVAEEICRACPSHGGSILLDVLSIQKSWAMDAAMKMWARVERQGVKIEIPAEHALFKNPGVVGEELCCHPFWRLLEARLVSEASGPRSGGPRM